MDSKILELLKNGGNYEDTKGYTCFMMNEGEIEWTGTTKEKGISEDEIKKIFLFESQTKEVTRIVYNEKTYDTFIPELLEEFLSGRMKYISLFFETETYYARHFDFEYRDIHTSFSYKTKKQDLEPESSYISRLYFRFMKDLYSGHEFTLKEF